MAFARQADQYLNRDELCWYLNSCGYPADSGACYGFVGACIPFLLMGRAHEINQRLFLMKQIITEFNIGFTDQHNLSDLLKNVIERGLSRYRLSRFDTLLVSEIPAFCEAIYFHYNPEIFSAWFPAGESPQSQNLFATLPVVLPLGLTSIAASPVFTGVYNQEERQFHDYFKSLAETIHAQHFSASIISPVAVLLCNLGHSTLVSYDARTKQWTFVDVKHQCVEQFESLNGLVATVAKYLSGNDFVLCSSQLFGVNQEMINALFRTWQQHPLWINAHRVEIAKFKLTDYYEANWAHIAAQNADINTLKHYFDLKDPKTVSNLNDINWFKLTPLQLAIQEGHETIVAYLLKHGVDPNFGELESPLMTAYKHNRYRIVAMLKRVGAKLKSDETCPASYISRPHTIGSFFRNKNKSVQSIPDELSNKAKKPR